MWNNWRCSVIFPRDLVAMDLNSSTGEKLHLYNSTVSKRVRIIALFLWVWWCPPTHSLFNTVVFLFTPFYNFQSCNLTRVQNNQKLSFCSAVVSNWQTGCRELSRQLKGFMGYQMFFAIVLWFFVCFLKIRKFNGLPVHCEKNRGHVFEQMCGIPVVSISSWFVQQ